ncbi:MMS19 nucleotide excision repair protein homolog isoform X2 [Actinidia eriantha]|uniref:MMS19 nucleotide excision repair protein homolog isoform X2 n=1 Tax=Actinidia eriantha TaxID=165200 RepID=UPI00258EF55B|nr:MMS19 nucleotide excision repair protein homolog isoform X2 [Actinidia eriantha]
MADSAHWVKHIEAYVDSSSSPSQQGASLDAIAALLKNDMLTIEALVREMEMYLTTTDNIIRGRGILLLAELLERITLKPLDDASIRSLIGFFTERLADWKALRGALLGCLALMKRKSKVGMVTLGEARAVAQSYHENLQVQSLGQHDRKLCFELLECLVDHYPDAVTALDDSFVYGICEAIDGEKDPRCLMITFHIVNVLSRLFPDPAGPVASYAEDLFEILGRYFPIHFTHAKDEEVDVTRDELSRALMLAFASTPLFEPFAIPLLLEKLSSSLPSSKVESLRYLSYCSVMYGADRMARHVETLWSSLRDAIFNSLEPISSLESEPLNIMGFRENEVATEALLLLQKVVLQNDGSFLSLIVGDEEVNLTIKSITDFKNYTDIPLHYKKKLHAVGRILYASARASIASCNKVFESFFLCLMDALGLSGSSKDSHPEDDYMISGRLNYGALCLCIELLAACRYLVLDSEELSLTAVSAHETWCCMLQSFCHSLTEAFCCTLITSTYEDVQNAYARAGVRGLQILATFPGSFLPVSKSIFKNILTRLMSVITLNADKAFLWKLSLKALVEIGSFVDNDHESDRAPSFKGLVVEKIISLMSPGDSTMPLSLKLEAISEIGSTSLNFMLAIVQGLENAVFANLSNSFVHGNVDSAEAAVELLGCFSIKLLPWFDKIGGFEEVPFQFAINVWDHIGKSTVFSIALQDKELIGATMTTVKLAVANCSEESQSIIIQKALNVLSSCTSFLSKESICGVTTTELEASRLNHGLNSFPCRDKWVVSLFASVIIALRPQTKIPNVELVLHVFITTLLSGYVPAAQALGSIVNKLPLKTNATDTSDSCSLEAALDIIFSTSLWTSDDNSLLRRCRGDGNEIGLSCLRLSNSSSRLLEVHAIVGLAWIGKGLLMRGHGKVKDITKTILSYLLSDSDSVELSLKQNTLKDGTPQDVLSLMKSAADAFHVLMSDSETCLNRRFHAVIRPLYKQRYFSTMMPILLSSVAKSDLSITRSMLYRVFAHIISDTPLSAILTEAKKLIPILLDSLSILSEDISDKDVIYNVLLVLSGILTDKNGQEAVVENVHMIIGRLLGLISYPHMMLVRETVIQCLVAMSVLPHAKIYPMRTQVLRAISNALDDPKRAVREEAVRCRQAWASIATRSLHF